MGLFGKKKPDPDLIYETSYVGTWIKVYPSRVVFKILAGEKSIPINNIASVQIGVMGLWQITLETTGGQKYKISCKKKKEVKEAIYKAQEAFSKNANNSGSNSSVADELTKLAQLKKDGILSEEEFDREKKKLLK